MKVTKHDGTQERLVLVGMIVSPTVIAKVASMYSGNDLFPSRLSNIVAKWAIDYHRSYNRPIGKDIRPKFDRWASRHRDQSDVTMVSALLESLSNEYRWKASKINHAFVVDTAVELFRETGLRRMFEEGLQRLDNGQVDKAEEVVSKFVKPNPEEDDNLQITRADVVAALDKKSEVLIQYPGDLGLFFGPAFERDGFISFIAPEKSTKSFWLQDVTWHALLCGKKVAYFDVGDMSKHQVIQRFITRAARQPLYSPDNFWPYMVTEPMGEITISEPIDTKEGIRRIDVTRFKNTRFREPLSGKAGWRLWRKWLRTTVRAKQDMVLSVRTYPNCTVNVGMLRSKLKTWEALKGWMPDVIVIDYADNLAPPSGAYRAETRDQINRTWQELRALSQERHCLVVTATQADAGSYGKWLIDRRNFSEDKRKLAHVTGMIGINISADEKDKGICRLNWINRRLGGFSYRKFVAVAGCLDLANPAILSKYLWKRSRN